MKKTSLLLMSLALVSCGGSKTSSTEYPAGGTTSVDEIAGPSEVIVSKELKHSLKRRTELEANLSNIEKFKKDLNTYTVYVRSNTRSFPEGELVCSKLLFDQRNNLFSSRFDERGEYAFLDIEIAPTDPVKVDFNCYVKFEGKLSNAFVIGLKKSFSISDEQSLNSEGIGSAQEIETLLLLENGILATEGKKIKLKVNEFVSAGGKVSTFKKETLNEKLKDVDGDSGGEVDLTINKASGTLTFDMKGRDAGSQTRLRAQKIALQADAALNGQCTRGPMKAHDTKCFGKDGQNGFDAEPGYPGFNGGSTGKLKLTITDARLLNLKITFNPGEGSLATPSTLPTAGQPGGIGSYLKWQVGNCRDYGPGIMTFKAREFCSNESQKFPDGKMGTPGKALPVELLPKNGLVGLIESAELNIDDKEFTIDTDWSSEEL